MDLLIAHPALALVPTALFFVLYRWSGTRVVPGVAVAWLAYAIYEYGMYRRWLCTGECNIRVDLLLVYPVLVIVSLAGVVSAVRARRRGRA